MRNAFCAVIAFPVYTYVTKVKKIDTFDMMLYELINDAMYAIDRSAFTSFLKMKMKIYTKMENFPRLIWRSCHLSK